MQKRFSFGLGTIFSLIIIYFIYLYSVDKNWKILAFAAKWYLIIVGGIFGISLGITLLVALFSAIFLLYVLIKTRLLLKKNKKKSFIDADFEIKD